MLTLSRHNSFPKTTLSRPVKNQAKPECLEENQRKRPKIFGRACPPTFCKGILENSGLIPMVKDKTKKNQYLFYEATAIMNNNFTRVRLKNRMALRKGSEPGVEEAQKPVKFFLFSHTHTHTGSINHNKHKRQRICLATFSFSFFFPSKHL